MANEAALGRAVLELATDDKQLTAGLAEAKAQAGGLGPALAGAGAQASTFGERLSLLGKQAGIAGTASKVLSSALGSFTVAGLATNAITAMVGAIGTLITKGTQLPAIEGSFNRLTSAVKINAGVMLGEMRRGTQSLVSDLDLMQSANKALLLGLPVTAQSMGDLANTARVLGKAMGQDATKSLDDLITALGRSSPMILDNLGLTVKVGEANEKYAAKLGKSADALTDGEKKLAFYEAAMEAARVKTEQLGEQTKTLGEIAQSVWVRVGNVVTETAAGINTGLGAALSSGKGFIDFLDDVIKSGPAVAVQMSAMREQIKALDAARRGAMGKDVVLESYESTLKKVRDSAAATTAAIVPLNAEQRSLAAQFEKSGKSAAQIAEELNKVQGWKVHVEAVNQAIAANKKATTAAEDHAQALADVKAAAIPLTSAQQAQAEANDRLGISASTTAKALGVNADAVQRYLDGLKAGAEIAETWREAHEKMADASRKFISKAVADWQAGQRKIADASGEAIAAQLKQATEFEQKNADVTRTGTALKLAQIERERDATIAALNAASSQRGGIYDRDLAAIKRFYQNQIDVANGTASTIEQRMRSQGVLTRAELRANADAATRDYLQMRDSGLYAAEEIQAAFERMNAAIAKSRGVAVNWGGELQRIAGILGQSFGSGKAGGVISMVDSIGKSMDVAKASTEKWGNSAGVAAPLFSSSASGAQKAAAAVATGATIASGAMDVWAATSEKTGKAAGALHGAVAGAKAGAAFGPYGAAIGAVAGALVGLIRNLNAGRDAVKKFADTFDTAAAGSGFDELHAKLLKVAGGEQLWIDATQKVGKGDVTAAKKAIEAINAALKDQDDWLGRLPGVLEKYGIAWTEAGQAVNQARLDEVAKSLIQDFADLSRAGVAVDVITTKMSESVNAYIQDAIRTGTEIPPAMRPLLQKMIELGTLTDENGNKITDLEGSGITFAQTMTEGFQSVVGAIKELTRALGGVPEAINKIPRSTTIDVEYRGRRTGIWEGAPEGETVIPEIPMARGGYGRVIRPTLFYSKGDEDFAFSGEGRSFGMSALASRPTEITVVSELDGRVVARNQIRHTPNELARAGVRSR